MIWCDNTYLKIWDINPEEKYVELRASTSRKDQNGQYVYSNWFPRCYGKAAEQAKNFKVKDRVKTAKMTISNEQYEAKDGSKKNWLAVNIYEFEDADTSKKSGAADSNPCDGSDLPF